MEAERDANRMDLSAAWSRSGRLRPGSPWSAGTRGVSRSSLLLRGAPRGVRWIAGVAVIAVVMVGCTGSNEPGGKQPGPSSSAPGTLTPVPSEPQTEPEPTPQPTRPTPSTPDVPRVTVDSVTTVADKLDVPWGVVRLPDGALLVTSRDTALLVRVDMRTGKKTPVTGSGAEALATGTMLGGEGGLLGIALSPVFNENHHVFVYRSTEDGNQVVRGELVNGVLGDLTELIGEIPVAANHNGGGLGFGPDGHLYIGTGDAGDGVLAQDVDSLAGKILRIAADGSIPADNPLPGSPLWSFGHRNVQGFGWDRQERMFASEFGASSLDELNLIRPGGNYGWPQVEGPGGDNDGFIDPIVSWPTSESSPSGLAVSTDAIYLAGLRGERLWRVPLAQVVNGQRIEPQDLLTGQFGRLRNVIALAGGDLLVVTGNTDGRGDPDKKDDLLLRLALRPLT